MNVDERYGDVKYYPNASYFALLTDGGIELGDGFGSVIRMAGGTITLSAPGDIVLQSGRDVVSLAGYDFIARAKNSFDISATLHDGRLKAHRNLWMAATGDFGGVLIESKAKYPSKDFGDVGQAAVLGGVVIKADRSLVEIDAADINLNTEGSLQLDATTGRLRLRGDVIEMFAGEAIYTWFVQADAVVAGSEWRADELLICSNTTVVGQLCVTGCGAFGDNLVSLGHVGTLQSRSHRGLVSQVGDSTDLDNTIMVREDRCGELVSIGDGELDTLESRRADYTLADVEFTHRTAEQYMAAGYVLQESRWQQLARQSGEDLPIWEEESVTGTYPYPGAGLAGEIFRRVDVTLWDPQTGTAVDRGAAYETPATTTSELVVPNEAYTVLI
jgi:hypothetical protein